MAHSFSSEERQNIRWALRSNPAILEHVSSLSEINSLTKNRLVDIMNALGIDIEEAKSGRYTEKMLGEPENGIHSDEYYAFSGYLDVAATLSINGEEIPGVVITEYDYTPEWPFFDKTVGRVRNMHGMGSYKFHFVDAEHYPMEQVSTKGRRLITPPDLTNAVDITSLVAENSLSIDDEGTPTQENILIEDGILRGYMQDRLNARLMGVAPTGNGRRESYAHAPMPRMTNTFMLAGERDPEEDVVYQSVVAGPEIVQQIGEEWYLPVWSVGPD